MFSTISRQIARNLHSYQKNIVSKSFVQYEKNIVGSKLGKSFFFLSFVYAPRVSQANGKTGQNRFYTVQVKTADFEAKYADKIKEIAKRFVEIMTLKKTN